MTLNDYTGLPRKKNRTGGKKKKEAGNNRFFDRHKIYRKNKHPSTIRKFVFEIKFILFDTGRGKKKKTNFSKILIFHLFF